MRRIKITGLPGGQAPEVIRRAWIGVEIPVDESEEQPCTQDTGGILVRGEQPVPKRVYTVFALDAFKALKKHNNGASLWWAASAPQWFREGMHLLFDESACELIETRDIKFTCYHQGCQDVEIEGTLGRDVTQEIHPDFIAQGKVERIHWDPAKPFNVFMLDGPNGERNCPKCGNVFVEVIIATAQTGEEIRFGYESEGI